MKPIDLQAGTLLSARGRGGRQAALFLSYLVDRFQSMFEVESPVAREISTEIHQATQPELRAYIAGASRDGTRNRMHRTLRISQSDKRWIELLAVVFHELGSRSWIYEEGSRGVYVIETTFPSLDPPIDCADVEKIAFIRGYFDAEGGIPRKQAARFYVQLVQKDLGDLATLRRYCMDLSIQCGKLHNPSREVDPEYWRFYVRSCSIERFVQLVTSWHPRKRGILVKRFGRPSRLIEEEAHWVQCIQRPSGGRGRF